MLKLKSWGLLVSAIALSLVTMVGIIHAVTAEASETHTGSDVLLENAFAGRGETAVAEPCGSGERLPEWTLCLHGQIIQQQNGTNVSLNDVSVSVSYGDKTVDGKTFVHPGQSKPTYGIDISLLEPQFLEPVTITAVLPHTTIQQQVTFFPDFETQSQEANIYASTVSALDETAVWGRVIDYEQGGAVQNGTVVAEHQGQKIEATTAPDSNGDLLYRFTTIDLTSIGAKAGDLINLTASYNDDIDQRQLLLTDEPEQVDFITGWKCDNFDPLPRQGAGFGLPRQGAGFGLPNVSCLWGFGLLDGTAQEGIKLTISIGDEVHETETQLFAGETQPRFGVALIGTEKWVGEDVEVTAVFNGQYVTENFPFQPDDTNHQRKDFSIVGASLLATHPNINAVNALEKFQGDIWAGTSNGLVRWNINSKNYTYYTPFDGLAGPHILALEKDTENNLWIATKRYGVTLYNLTNGQWTTFDTTNSGLTSDNVYDVAIDGEGNIWFATHDGINRYTPQTDQWRSYLPEAEIDNDRYWASLEIDTNGIIWAVSKGHGGAFYSPATDQWQSFVPNSTELLATDITIDADDNLWIATRTGARFYNTSTKTWKFYNSSNVELVDERFMSTVVDQDGAVWFGTLSGGLEKYDPQRDRWQRYSRASSGLVSDVQIEALLLDTGKRLWVGTGQGLNRVNTNGTQWATYQQDFSLAPADHYIRAMAFANDNELVVGSRTRGLSIYNKLSESWEHLHIGNSQLPSNRIMDLKADKHVLWIGLDVGLVRFDTISDQWQFFDTTNSGILTNEINVIAIHPNGDVWIGHPVGVSHFDIAAGKWHTYTPANTNLAYENVRAIAVDQDGVVWLGDEKGNLTVYFPEINQWFVYNEHNSFLKHDDAINVLAVGRDNGLWIGHDIEGVTYFHRGTNEARYYDVDNSALVSNHINDIDVDNNGEIWISATAITHYKPNSDSWHNLLRQDLGLGNGTMYIEVDPSGDIWFGGDGVSNWEIVPHQSDVSVRVVADAQTTPSGDVQYVITAVNQGQIDTNATLTVELPDNTTLANVNIKPVIDEPLTFSLNSLQAYGSERIVRLTVKLDEAARIGDALLLNATISGDAPELFFANNTTQATTVVRDPHRADVRVSMSGPPLIQPNGTAVYHIWFDNIGGLDAKNAHLDLTLPAGMQLQSAVPSQSRKNPPRWNLGTIAALSEPTHYVVTTKLAASDPASQELTLTATVRTSTTDADMANNTAVVTTATSLNEIETLILVTPQRLADRYGASPLTSKLYTFAQHERVNGAVIDLMQDKTIADAYTAWDNNPSSWQAANSVAIAIKTQIDEYTITYPSVRYLLIVGGDEMIPFYRVSDQNGTPWQERGYFGYVPAGPVQAALSANKLLTDNYYADRTPTVPQSPFWTDNHPLYLPDFANGRLVETPSEMITAIDTFIANDGKVRLDEHLVGALPALTSDLAEAQCALFTADGMATTCLTDQPDFANEALRHAYDGVWSAPHSNHLSVGLLAASDMAQSSLNYKKTLNVSAGCHAGLNVAPAIGADGNGPPDLDMAQAMLGQGSSYVASTAYTYASFLSTGYTEALALLLTEALVSERQVGLGDALVEAKQSYYASRADWFDYTDEKVVLPMTLYGFPMLQIITPDAAAKEAETTLPTELVYADVGETAVRYTFDDFDLQQHETAVGSYFTAADSSIAQEGMPVQPLFQSDIPLVKNGQTVRGLLFQGATYSSIPNFDPVIAQSWAIEAMAEATLGERPFVINGWDRAMPFGLGRFDGVTQQMAQLNLVLGRFNSQTHTQQLFDSVVLDVTYSNSSDTTPPALILLQNGQKNGRLQITLHASDNEQLAGVTAVCDDENGRWQTVPLTLSNGKWQGECPVNYHSYFVQLVDDAGNVTHSIWFDSNMAHYSPNGKYLPSISTKEKE